MAKTYLDETGLATLWGKIKAYVTNAVKVTGVKGNAETSYRTGNVNLTAANVGAFEKVDYAVGTTETGIRPLVNRTRADRLIFLPADQIIIEQTTDGGTTWTDASISDAVKADLFTENNTTVKIPLLNNAKSTNCGLRITITGMKYDVPSGTAETQKYNYWNKDHILSLERYFNVREWWFWISSNNDLIKPEIYCATGANPNNWVTVFNKDFGMAGWSGSDYIRAGDGKTFGGGTTQTGNYWNWRLIFWSKMQPNQTSFLSAAQQSIAQIRCYGDNVWGGNTFAQTDHIYTWSRNKDVTFPAKVTATGGFSGSLTGNATGLSSDVGRTNSANNKHDDVRRMQVFLATNSMTTGKPPADAHILHFNWDNGTATTGSYDSQLAITGGSNSSKMYVRSQTSGTWQDWAMVYDTRNKPSKSDVGLGNVDNTADANKSVAYASNAGTVNNLTVQTAVPANAKFTDTVTTVTTTGSGNAVTGITASNGALTATKGSTFLTQHQSNANLGHGYHTVTTSSSGVYAINAPGYNLVEGSRISILFKNAVTEATPKLNVNSTGEKSIYYNGSALNPTAITYATAVIASNSVVTLVYDGVRFVITAIENPNRIVVPGYQLDSTGSNTTKTIKMSNYSLCAGSLFTVSFTHDNTASHALNLNINETGIKTLFINGKPSSSSNCTLPAGTYLIYYDGTNYYVRTDGKYPGASSLPTREDISADFITNNMRVVVRSAIRYGKMVELELLVNRSSAWANGSSGDITATFTSNHLPYAPAETTVMWGGGVLVGTIAGEGGYINSTKTTHGQGYVLFRNLSGSSISKDTDASIPFVFRYIYDDGNITVPDLSGYNLSN